MAKKTRKGDVTTADYRHTGEKRKNIPPAKIAAEGKVPRVPRVHYEYSPHLHPTLRFDSTGKADTLPELIATSARRPLNESEQQLLAGALRDRQPWLEWAGKREQNGRHHFDVDPLALHIHERISTQAIVRAASRADVQRDLFADPQQSYANAVQFYKHNVDWANRLILGDSVDIMSSLAQREGLAGHVQVIYLDPPYGINFKTNFQPTMDKGSASDRDAGVSREPEMVRAYRDTWHLGLHSYLSYLRDRFIVAKDLLAESGSIFVQISEQNCHSVRCLLDEVFEPQNFVAQVGFRKKLMPLGAKTLEGMCDYLLWFARDLRHIRYHQLYVETSPDPSGRWTGVRDESGVLRRFVGDEGQDFAKIADDADLFGTVSQWAPSYSPTNVYDFTFEGRSYSPSPGQCWVTTSERMTRLAGADRLFVEGAFPRYVSFHRDFPLRKLTHPWQDTAPAQDKRYVVATSAGVVERCLLMTSDPGDLVLDPTCGSGTTAYVAEQWGRRWITMDTSRVAIAVARQRILTSTFVHYRTKAVRVSDGFDDPGAGFVCRTIGRVALKSIAQNTHLDAIFAKHEALLDGALERCNRALSAAPKDLGPQLANILEHKETNEGKRAISEADRRRWLLPPSNREAKAKLTVDPNFAGWYHWEVPFDSDPKWPEELSAAIRSYRELWSAKMQDVDRCIEEGAEPEELVDQPEIVKGLVRVAGPFTVEGVRPEELSPVEEGVLEPTANALVPDAEGTGGADDSQTYLTLMIQHLRTDGLTFLDNQHHKFSRLDPLFEDGSGSLIHAEGSWDGNGHDKGNAVGITFGPQYGPVTALQLEEAIRAAKQYDELVIAGFSFDAEAFAVAEEQSHPKLRVYLAQIRPDLSQAMRGLLKDTPNSQLFSVFGQPDVVVTDAKTKDGWVCTLNGVEIYDPLHNTVRSCGADKVAAWFLDSDFDGRCFCITQAFFPDQTAWDKIARALGSSADLEAFEAFKGTTSLPFTKGKYGRIAVKVIDPRGNEVMAIRKLS